MTRALVIIRNENDRSKIARWAAGVPLATRVEFKAPRRSMPQNDLMWARLTEISAQVDWYGEKLSATDWKDVFTAALRKSRVVPGIDAGTFVAIGMHTSDLTVSEFTNLLDLMDAFAAQHGVVFHGDRTC